MRRWKFDAAVLLLAAALAGCGAKTPDNVGQVSGKVTLEGQPLPDALVTFAPVKPGGSTAAGKTDAGGNYQLHYSSGVEGAEIGENRVAISTYDEGSPDIEPPRPKVPEKVPLKYNIRSELVRDVKQDANTFDFDLKTDGPVIADPSTIGEGSSSCSE